ncbi:MAG TPA: mechanosensitive ion channel domain-containing protein [Opitutaceae bacterium]
MEAILEFLQRPFELGNLRFTPLSLLVGVGLIVALIVVVAVIKRVLRDRLLPRAGLNRGVSIAVSTLVGYGLILVGVLIILPVMIPGFNLNTLSLMLGAISFGIGFGLRNIADNFVSGIILLIERPIKVGDRIQVGSVYGDVVEIRARSTTVRTNDNVDIVVPNSEFISSQVTNVSHRDTRVRFRFPVGVHYKSDVHAVAKALVEAALACPDVLRDPPPQAKFLEFGESSLNFEIWVWTDTMFNRPQNLRSAVNFQVWDHLKRAGIEVPYPQRDLYVKELPQTRRVEG